MRRILSPWPMYWPTTVTQIPAIALLIVGLVVASGVTTAVPPPARSSDESAAEVPNIAIVRGQIMRYYGDSGDHLASPTSAYAGDVGRVEDDVRDWLQNRPFAPKAAVVFDIDDTLLLSYSYGATHEFSGYTLSGPTSGPLTRCVLAHCLTAVFGMPQLVSWVRLRGYTIFFITSRPDSLRDATLQNLSKRGFGPPEELFEKPTAKGPFPSYLPCRASCTTIDYKSGTRAHIESLGYHIVATIGDQASDLAGGHAERGFKLPNPMYFTP